MRPTTAGLVASLIVCISVVAASSAERSAPLSTDPTLETRIQHIRDEILPPVVVAGLPPAPVTKLADLMAKSRVPGVSLAVIHDGAIAWARGFGVTHIGGPPVTPETLFQAPAIGRLLTAMAVLRQVDLHKVDLDADVNNYLKSWKIPQNGFTDQAKVTLRQLLSNTAGVTVPGFPGYTSDAPLPTLIQVLNGEKPAINQPITVDSIPGTRWRYSNGGYAVIQQLLEDVTGQPFVKLMRSSVLDRVGMSRSTFEQPLPKARLAAEAAIPFRRNGEAFPGGPFTFPEMAPAGLWTTPSDLARYVIEVQQSIVGKSNKIISSAMIREMLAPGTSIPSQPVSQGLGPTIGGSSERRYFRLNGANGGFATVLIAYNQGDGAIIMTNGENGLDVATPLIRAIAHEYAWPNFRPVERNVVTLNPSTYDKFQGTYDLSSGGAFRIRKIDDKLTLIGPRGVATEMYPESNNRYFITTLDVEYVFNVLSDGEVSDGAIEGRNFHAEFKKVPEITFDAKLFDRFVGRYQFASGNAVTVTRDADRFFIQLDDQARVEVWAESEREFIPAQFPGKATFETDTDGRAFQLIWLQNGRTVTATRIE
jgi:CubicO group peptidase (beta-lactamase class C family)